MAADPLRHDLGERAPAAGHSADLAPEQESQELSRLANELAALGAETPAARNAKRIIPWFVSVILHIALVAVALLITWTVTRTTKEEAILIVADFDALNYVPVVGTDASETVVTGPEVRDAAPPGAQTVTQQLRSAEGDPLSEVAGMIGAGSGSAGGATLSGFAPRAGPTVVRFAGASGSNARSIVYVIDASGSMISHIQFVVDELSRSLEALNPKQTFSVVFFQRNDALAVPPANRMLPATDAEKVRALEWIRDNIVPQGRSNPLAALEVALNHKPDVIFILSEGITGSGEFEIDQKDLLAKLAELNPVDPASGRRRTQINCIQFLDPDPLDTLSIIAREHGGPNGYKFLSREELGVGRQ
jgi:hypothetical protein